jgi:hypothetical protein
LVPLGGGGGGMSINQPIVRMIDRLIDGILKS